MKNKNILPGEVVPAKIRLKVYKEALDIISNDTLKQFELGIGLCLMLPCVLWGLAHYTDQHPLNRTWNYKDSEYIFPEISGISMDQLSFYDVTEVEEKNTLRMIYLIKAIEACEKLCN